jgi:hypothetical protein
VVGAWKRAVAKHHGELGGGGNLEVGLNLVQGLAMGGVTDAETVKAESVVLVLIGRDVDDRNS